MPFFTELDLWATAELQQPQLQVCLVGYWPHSETRRALVYRACMLEDVGERNNSSAVLCHNSRSTGIVVERDTYARARVWFAGMAMIGAILFCTHRTATTAQHWSNCCTGTNYPALPSPLRFVVRYFCTYDVVLLSLLHHRAVCDNLDMFLDIPSPLTGDKTIILNVGVIECEIIEGDRSAEEVETIVVEGGTLTIASDNTVQ